MEKEYKIVEPEQTQEQENDFKQIEVTEMVEVKRTFNISQLKQQLKGIAAQRTNLDDQEAKINADIEEAQTSLNLK